MINNKNGAAAVLDDTKTKVGLTDLESPTNPRAPLPPVKDNAAKDNNDDTDIESLDLVRKILLGDQVRKAERQQASMERHIRDAMDSLNKEMRQEINSLRKDLQALEQKSSDWRHDMLTHIKQADRQVQQQRMDRQDMADLLRSMAQLAEQDNKPANKTASYDKPSFTPNNEK